MYQYSDTYERQMREHETLDRHQVRKPKVGDLVRVEWVDIVSGCMSAGDCMARAWAIGYVAEWNQPAQGTRRTVIETGAWYDEDNDTRRDKTVLPHAVITEWRIYS